MRKPVARDHSKKFLIKPLKMSGNDESQFSSTVFGSMKLKATMCGEVFPAASFSNAFHERLSCWASLVELLFWFKELFAQQTIPQALSWEWKQESAERFNLNKLCKLQSVRFHAFKLVNKQRLQLPLPARISFHPIYVAFFICILSLKNGSNLGDDLLHSVNVTVTKQQSTPKRKFLAMWWHFLRYALIILLVWRRKVWNVKNVHI